MVDSLLMIKAEEIHKRIEEGKPVEYENVIIYGDLDLHNLDLPLNRNKRTMEIADTSTAGNRIFTCEEIVINL